MLSEKCRHCKTGISPACISCVKNDYSSFKPDTPHDFESLQFVQNEWQKHNFPKTLQHQPLLGLAEEVGELSHAHLKCEQGIRETSINDKKDAVGDIAIYLASYCNLNGLDLADCVKTAWSEVSQRDWVKFPKNGKSE